MNSATYLDKLKMSSSFNKECFSCLHIVFKGLNINFLGNTYTWIWFAKLSFIVKAVKRICPQGKNRNFDSMTWRWYIGNIELMEELRFVQIRAQLFQKNLPASPPSSWQQNFKNLAEYLWATFLSTLCKSALLKMAEQNKQ